MIKIIIGVIGLALVVGAFSFFKKAPSETSTTVEQPVQTSQSTPSKKQATALINQTDASASAFNTMNDSANKLDENISL